MATEGEDLPTGSWAGETRREVALRSYRSQMSPATVPDVPSSPSCRCATPVPTTAKDSNAVAALLWILLGFLTCGLAWLGLLTLLGGGKPVCRVCGLPLDKNSGAGRPELSGPTGH